MVKAVFIDRDGVIIKDVGHLHKREDIELIEGSAEAIKLLNDSGIPAVLITNQPVVARNLCSIKDVEEIHNKLRTLLKSEGAYLDKIYFCPHHPTGGDNPNREYVMDCECRKPKPGMILEAKEHFGIEEINDCFMIGDQISDIKSGNLAGCKTILVKTGSTNNDKWKDAEPTYKAKNLYEAITKIVLGKKNEEGREDRKIKLLISAGGEGSRLRPLTENIPKQMIPIAGKPVLHHLVDWAKKHGINEIVMLSGRKAEKISEYFGDGNSLGVNIKHLVEPQPLGTGGIIKFAKPHIKGKFIYISGDLVTNIDLKKMLDFHERKKAQITVHVHESNHPYDSDILEIDDEGRIKRFVSKHEDHAGVGNLSNSGLSIIEEEVLDLMEEEKFNYENYLYPKVLDKGMRFYGYHTEEYIADMGTFDRLKKCEEFIKSNPEFFKNID